MTRLEQSAKGTTPEYVEELVVSRYTSRLQADGWSRPSCCQDRSQVLGNGVNTPWTIDGGLVETIV